MEVSSTRFYYDRAYLYLIFALIVTLAGFLPTYIGRFDTIESAHHYHGFTALLWMIILVVQRISSPLSIFYVLISFAVFYTLRILWIVKTCMNP